MKTNKKCTIKILYFSFNNQIHGKFFKFDFFEISKKKKIYILFFRLIFILLELA